MKPLRHIPDVINRLNENPHHKNAFNYKKEGVWHHLSTEEVVDKILCIALSLKDLGIEKGDRIGIYAKSSPFWAIADFAIVLACGVTVPFFSNLSEKHFVYEVEQSQPKWIFIGDKEDWKNVKPHRHHFKGLINIEKGAVENTTFSFRDLVEIGSTIKKNHPHKIKELEDAIHPDDLATIIYSSGSTGSPKGVELTHKNLVSIIHYDEFELRPNDKYLSILPLPHIFAKQVHLIMTAWGVPIYFLNNLKEIPETCAEFPITRMITVPRVLEKAYSKMRDKLKKVGFIKRTIGNWAFDLAHREEGIYKALMHPIADKLVYSKVRDGFGKDFHSILSGGAALSPYLHRFYLSVGIPIMQGWGLTEGSTIAVNRLNKNKIGTVGPPIPGITFKISEEGEVLAKGPTIMRGYHQNPEATKKAIDAQGWLHTGDFGRLDEDGHLIIDGRMNESFKTSHGEFVIPVTIEQKLTESPLIDMAMVIGENLPYPAVLFFPDFDALENFKKIRCHTPINNEDFLESEIIKEEITTLLEQVNETLSPWEKIHDYRFILKPLTIEGRELTPTLKIRRKIVQEKYQDLIKEIYSQPKEEVL